MQDSKQLVLHHIKKWEDFYRKNDLRKALYYFTSAYFHANQTGLFRSQPELLKVLDFASNKVIEAAEEIEVPIRKLEQYAMNRKMNEEEFRARVVKLLSPK